MSSIERLNDDQHFGNYLKEYEKLMKLHKPIDLGLGYPDYLPSKFVTDALVEALSSTNPEDYQYTSVKGHPRLRNALSTTFSPLLGKHLDPENEILVTAGSSEALYCALTSLISPGDEVIIIEPCFMVFVELVKMAGGVPKYLSLELTNRVTNNRTSADWTFDKAALRGLFTEKTKAIVMNTPHNPTGKVFDIEELRFISELCIANDLICISDEVYERMVYKPSNHHRIASLPGMFERTVTLGAAEKSFGVTGWQIGWAYGPGTLLKKLQTLHQRVVYNASTPLQIAFAKMLETEARVSYFDEMENELTDKRDYLVQMLFKTKMEPILPEGGMFVLADVSEIASRVDLSGESGEFVDMKFVNWLAKCHGLQAFPVTVFCAETGRKKRENLVRFCFAKKRQTLEEAAFVLSKFELAPAL